MQKLSRIKSIRSIRTGDFSTLYTSLPHDVIIDQMIFLTDLLFKHCSKKYLCLGYKKCWYSENMSIPKQE